ncbi:ANTAR domain-containing response regulator [Pararobbsia silviterrae]|uniref:ANTAR domain-containing protein n=1 Tax=Pararobbsia silviterrae TaxID=1792498 RepID=A0A494YH96_9BURK|nr:ANTAR domain-containing protein [Pararobbsia silviterrae]
MDPNSPPPSRPMPAGEAPKGAALRILLVRDPFNSHDEDVEAIRTGLAEAGYELVSVADADVDLPERIERSQPDMVIIESEAAARDVLEHVCFSTRNAPRPIVLFTDNNDTERMRTAFAAGITAYIVDGLTPERVKPVLDVALARFGFEQQLRGELASARNQLAERKLVERAKGLLIKQFGISEDEAYHRLRRLAMEKKLRLAQAAQWIIDIAAAVGD